MNPITDDDLVLYHYRDGLDAARIDQITSALAASEALRARYATIERAVAQFGQDEIAPDSDFNARLWQRIEPQLKNENVISSPVANASVSTRVVSPPSSVRENANASTGVATSPSSVRENANASTGTVSSPSFVRGDANDSAAAVKSRSTVRDRASRPAQSAIDRLRSWLTPGQLWPAFAASTVLAMAIGAAFLAGRESVTVSPPIASTEADAAAARVLDAYVASNLRATERVLLTASNSDDASLLEGNRELAQSLVESNRLYSLAAERSGNTRLATFLRQLEPILISLANQPGSAAVQSSEDLRQFLDTTDLLFQVRATEARLDRAPKNGDSRI